MKKLFILPLIAIGLILGGQVYATSTVILDPPDIATAIDNMYDVAQPLFDSIDTWIWYGLGILFVFAIVRLIFGLFR